MSKPQEKNSKRTKFIFLHTKVLINYFKITIDRIRQETQKRKKSESWENNVTPQDDHTANITQMSWVRRGTKLTNLIKNNLHEEENTVTGSFYI